MSSSLATSTVSPFSLQNTATVAYQLAINPTTSDTSGPGECISLINCVDNAPACFKPCSIVSAEMQSTVVSTSSTPMITIAERSLPTETATLADILAPERVVSEHVTKREETLHAPTPLTTGTEGTRLITVYRDSLQTSSPAPNDGSTFLADVKHNIQESIATCTTNDLENANALENISTAITQIAWCLDPNFIFKADPISFRPACATDEDLHAAIRALRAWPTMWKNDCGRSMIDPPADISRDIRDLVKTYHEEQDISHRTGSFSTTPAKLSTSDDSTSGQSYRSNDTHHLPSHHRFHPPYVISNSSSLAASPNQKGTFINTLVERMAVELATCAVPPPRRDFLAAAEDVQRLEHCLIVSKEALGEPEDTSGCPDDTKLEGAVRFLREWSIGWNSRCDWQVVPKTLRMRVLNLLARFGGKGEHGV